MTKKTIYSASTRMAMINTLTAALVKSEGLTRSAAMSKAWNATQTFPELKYLVFRKKSNGKITRRVVSENWFELQAPRGGQSNRKPGQEIFADLAKYLAGAGNIIISAYKDSIIYYA